MHHSNTGVVIKILIEQFCALSTSPSWQSWLYHFDQELYSWYINKLRASTGCNANRELMKDVLNRISDKNGGERLSVFLRTNFPQMIKDGTVQRSDTKQPDEHNIFDSYVPGILTYPRRIIFVGSDLRKQITQFCLDKPINDNIIVGDKAYVEYLEKADMHLKDMIPRKNWQIAVYRNKHNV